MGHPNQLAYAVKRVPASPGRILEVGSRQVGSTQDFRGFYRGEYVGLDLQAGEGVDVVQDLARGLGPLLPASFDFIICCSVLEHVRKPWVMAENITELLRPGGILYLAVPWVWRFHAYPDDYFRFSWRGVETIFPDLKWEDFTFSTLKDGDFFPATEGSDNARATAHDDTKYLPYLELHGIGKKHISGVAP